MFCIEHRQWLKDNKAYGVPSDFDSVELVYGLPLRVLEIPPVSQSCPFFLGEPPIGPGDIGFSRTALALPAASLRLRDAAGRWLSFLQGAGPRGLSTELWLDGARRCQELNGRPLTRRCACGRGAQRSFQIMCRRCARVDRGAQC